MLQRELDQIIPPILWNTVPDRLWARRAIRQGIKPTFDVTVVPAIECGAGNAQHVEGLLRRQMGPLNGSDDFQLFGCRVSHSSNSPAPVMLFLSRRFSRVRSATHSFSAVASDRSSFTSGDQSSGKRSTGSFSDPPHTCRAVSPPSR